MSNTLKCNNTAGTYQYLNEPEIVHEQDIRLLICQIDHFFAAQNASWYLK